MPTKYKEIRCKSCLGNLTLLGTRFWTRHCFDPYINCELNCIYCNTSTVKIVNSKEGFVPVQVKINAPQILDKELAKLKKKGVVSIGLAMDAYQPIEKQFQLTRKILEVLKNHNCPFAIGTKSDLVLRDIEIISEASKRVPCLVSLSITTLDKNLAKILEPNASPPNKRIEALRKLSDKGVITGVWLSPILPYITDSEKNIAAIIEAAAKNGARFVLGGTLDMRSPSGILRFLNDNYPHLIPKYNRLYKRKDGSYSYYPLDSYLYNLYEKFLLNCKKFDIEYYMPHFHTRKQALLFYIRKFGIDTPSIYELLPLLNYLSPTQEILQTVNLRFKNRALGQGILRTFRYFPH